jgi:uncharacterized protein
LTAAEERGINTGGENGGFEMASRRVIDEFLGERALAVVGVSRGGRKFGNTVYRELLAKGYRVFAVHPEASTIEGRPCWPNLKRLPEPVGGVVVVVPPARTEEVVRDAREAGIRRVWMQQGAESPDAVRFCEANGMIVVQKECVLMFAEPTGCHRLHRWLWGLLGKLPR